MLFPCVLEDYTAQRAPKGSGIVPGGAASRGGRGKRCRRYPARLLAVMAMKTTITTSLTTHEFVFIQSRAFSRNACAR